jgi:hypothetical protein
VLTLRRMDCSRGEEMYVLWLCDPNMNVFQ